MSLCVERERDREQKNDKITHIKKSREFQMSGINVIVFVCHIPSDEQSPMLSIVQDKIKALQWLIYVYIYIY